jgi:hypothetical protein
MAKCAWPPCDNNVSPWKRNWKVKNKKLRFCGRACACRWVASQRTPEQLRAAGREGAAANKALARARVGERFATKRDAYMGGFRRGYGARLDFEKRHGMIKP